ncbi:putative leucine-rich repeat domain, L domain-containing protein [Medicago truncatula]|uniref:Putative leucine-rich repeat domain, L domain-containing protein n=2 Tax=Medicago truncatula TaxID=3880 RepID=A0A396I3W7_MEDTR|nr:putative leucine-rich repeat domain, L domain-containing protein [Medicago truncatula]
MSVQHSNSLKDFVVRPQLKSLNLGMSQWLRDESIIKSLNLGMSQWLRDESIIMFASIFPNLHMLDLSYCYNISKEGIYQVLKRCKIRDLNLTSSRVNLLGMNFEVPKLEVLNLSYTNIDDEKLYVTSKNCRELSRVVLMLEYFII